MGEVGGLHYTPQPNGNTTSGALSLPFLSHLEFHPTLPGLDSPFEELMKILRERKEAGRPYRGRIQGCSSEESLKLTRFVDVPILVETTESSGN